VGRFGDSFVVLFPRVNTNVFPRRIGDRKEFNICFAVNAKMVAGVFPPMFDRAESYCRLWLFTAVVVIGLPDGIVTMPA
jgi:hypothetical protein